MEMKRNVKIGICIFSAIVFLVMILVISNMSRMQIAEGTYRVTNCDEYPDAYIVVNENNIQFYNIDLNMLYREEQIKDFQGWIEHGVGGELTEEQIEMASDLNEMFVSNSWEIDYDLESNNKQGTFSYVYFCIVKDTRFGLVLQYDSMHKTIQLNNADTQKILVFKKTWLR